MWRGITSVKFFTLHDSATYSMDDMNEVLKIVKVAKSLYVTAPIMQESVGCWQDLADNAAGMEQLLIVGGYYYPTMRSMHKFGKTGHMGKGNKSIGY